MRDETSDLNDVPFTCAITCHEGEQELTALRRITNTQACKNVSHKLQCPNSSSTITSKYEQKTKPLCISLVDLIRS